MVKTKRTRLFAMAFVLLLALSMCAFNAFAEPETTVVTSDASASQTVGAVEETAVEQTKTEALIGTDEQPDVAAVPDEEVEILQAETTEEEEYQSKMYSTFWSLIPPVIAIVLALITKEVYISLFVGIVAGALFYSNFNLETTIHTIFYGAETSDGLVGGMIAKMSDSWNLGILIFLVVLGIIVVLMNKAGGSAAYGKWAVSKIKDKKGAALATFGLGALIFVDDYFNCLTVGSVMRPVTDTHKISRAKLAYLIDATAAPICIIAPISSWAAAVSGFAEDGNGLGLFIRTIPYNFYALLTIIMIITLTLLKFEYGPMKKHEINAEHGDIYTTDSRPYADAKQEKVSAKGKVIDLVIPVIVLVIFCIIGMIYTGGFFDSSAETYRHFVSAFASCDASVGLVLGSFFALVFAFLFFVLRRVLTFREFAEAIPEGFKAMVPAILILIFAWTLSGVTGLLGADVYVEGLIKNSAAGFQNFLPAIIFLVSLGLAFATGTSWGTFGILLPIIVPILSGDMLIISMSACLAGAVCGDHCSPISDTTIMASAGAQCDHINHVSTQLPYALTVAAVSCVSYIIAGFVQNVFIVLPIAIALMIATLFVIKAVTKSKNAA